MLLEEKTLRLLPLCEAKKGTEFGVLEKNWRREAESNRR
jgi:hypothetical protein